MNQLPKSPHAGFPDSPCVDICTLDNDNVCVGCSRTINEIVRWASMSAEEQWAVLGRLGERRKP